MKLCLPFSDDTKRILVLKRERKPVELNGANFASLCLVLLALFPQGLVWFDANRVPDHQTAVVGSTEDSTIRQNLIKTKNSETEEKLSERKDLQWRCWQLLRDLQTVSSELHFSHQRLEQLHRHFRSRLKHRDVIWSHSGEANSWKLKKHYSQRKRLEESGVQEPKRCNVTKANRKSWKFDKT